MTRVICVGDVMVDVLAQLPHALAVGSDTPSPVSLLGGGSAANTAAWLVSVGVASTFVGRVGDDALGRAAVDELAAAGVDLAVGVDPRLPTGICIVLVGPGGERTMVPSAGANAVGGDLPVLAEASHLHLSGYALFHPASRAAAIAALRDARAVGCPVSVDAASAAPLADFGATAFLAAVAPTLLFANAAEAAVLAGTDDRRARGAQAGRSVRGGGRQAGRGRCDVVRRRGPRHPDRGAGRGARQHRCRRRVRRRGAGRAPAHGRAAVRYAGACTAADG